MNQLPDVEVIFEFNGTRKSPANDGYRPAHLITDNYLTTGIHHYYGVESVPPNGTVNYIFISRVISALFMDWKKNQHTRRSPCCWIRNYNQHL